MNNCILIDDRVIDLSDETIKNIKSQLNELTWAQSVIAKYPQVGSPGFGQTCKLEIVNSRTIRIPLPGANCAWTFEVFDLAKMIKDEFEGCPIHISCNNNTDYLYMRAM